MRDRFRFSTNNLTASAAGKRILNPSHTRCHISPWMNVVISGVNAVMRGPFAMARSRACCVEAGPVCTGITLSTYFCSRGASGCRTASDSAPRVPHCLEATKAVRKGACVCASNVFFAVAVSHTYGVRSHPAGSGSERKRD